MIYSIHILRHLRLVMGSNIHRRRAGLKIPLRKLSRLTGVPEFRLDQYEMGKDQISFEHLVKIAAALDADMRDLMQE